MEVKVAKTAGFCWGVKRAVNVALEARSQSQGEVFTHGPLIHNRRVVEYLKNHDIGVYDTPRESSGDETLIIRAHGLPPDKKRALADKGFDIVDATCPHVVSAQKEVEKFSKQGYHIVIAGDRNHAEVIGLTGFAESPVKVIDSESNARNVAINAPILLIAQSTYHEDEFKKIAQIIQQNNKDVVVKNTICRATSVRQKEIIELAREVDALVIVGDKISANTQRLYLIAASQGKPVYFVEGSDEIDEAELKQYRVVGVTAGASTPGWETDAVIAKLKKI